MSTKNTAATAGRGFLVITGAKLWFMVGGVLINFGLPYIFGSRIYGDGVDGRALYGQYIDLNNTLSILSMVMITGVMQSVSKFIAERPERPGGLVAQARKLMLIFGGLVAGAFIYMAPQIAAWRSNPHLVNGYRAAGLILFFYGVYTVYIGTLNGRKQFARQALFDIGFTTLKTTLVMSLALLGFGVIGAFSGFALAAGIIMALAVWRVGRDLPDGQPATRLISFASKVMLYTLVFNLIFKLDILLLKPAAAALIQATGGDLDADGVLGLYGLAVNISRIPWQATIAITFVVFPLVSEATFAEDRARARLYIRQTLRYSMLLVGAAAVALAAAPHAIVGLLPAKFAAAAAPLVWLAPAYFFFSLFNVVNTLLMSSGRAGAALLVGGLTVGLAAGLYYTLLPGAGDLTTLMIRAGQCTLIAFSVGLLAGLGVLWRAYGAPLPLGTTLRVLGLGAALLLIGPALPAGGRVISLAVAVAVGVTFILGLIITREFGAEDKARLMRVLGRSQ
ncbi:oligosaccharide flippase family protein [Myxococcota bacterium]|nr:oligosaccharide flippase family protein [Myxococcota bacterium]MBU1898608.1 oligosaccharide flippase family protein [Myxococcota bacterium]